MAPWHLFGHFIFGLGIGIFFYFRTKQKKYLLICLLASFLIDFDHLFDFWLASGFSLSISKFLELNFFEINNRVYVPLHSWELIALLIITSRFLKKYQNVLWAIALSMLAHIFWDALSYQINILDYSLFWRASHDFKIGDYQ